MPVGQTNISWSLGKRLATYSPDSSRAIWVAPIILAALTLWGLFAWQNLATVPRLALGTVMLTLGVGTAWALRQRFRTRRIELHQHGVVLTTGRRQQWMHWNDIREVYQEHAGRVRNGARVAENWSYRLVDWRGVELRLQGFEGLRSLGHRIQNEDFHFKKNDIFKSLLINFVEFFLHIYFF